eukprot:30583_2
MSPVRVCAAFALILAVSALSAFAATPVPQNLTPGGVSFTITNIADRSNVFVYGTVTGDVTLTIVINDKTYTEKPV